MRLQRIAIVLTLVAACGKSGDKAKPDEGASKPKAAEASTKEQKAEPAKDEPKPEPAAAAPTEDGAEARVVALAEAPGNVFSQLGDAPAVHMVWPAKDGAPKATLSCIDDSGFAAAVHDRAQDVVKDGVSCDAGVCLIYGSDDVRTAFVYRADGTLAGVLENIETSDADGTDGEIAEMEKVLAAAKCPP